MPRPSSPELVVLLGMRLTSLAEVDDLAARWGLPADVVAAEVERAAAHDRVRYREGRLHGWALTAEGRRACDRMLDAELDRSGARPAIEAAYEAFLALNGELLATCTAWQLRDVAGEQVVNEHDDPAYDAACVDRLVALDDRVAPIVADLAAQFDRFASYPHRLGAARQRVQAGDGDWFTSPTVDSYHTVWFELHEHLLASLGLDRSREEPVGVGASASAATSGSTSSRPDPEQGDVP